MRRISRLFAMLAVLSLVLAPSFGWAKAGGGASMGSRGSQTFSAPRPTNTAPVGVQPMQRTITPQSQPGYGNPGVAPGMAPQLAPRSSFMSGLMGGLIGAGIGGLLFGGGMFGGISGFGGFLGFILQAALIFFVGRWLLGMIFNRSPAAAMAGGTQVPFTPNRPVSGGGMGGGVPQPRPVAIGPADYTAFEQLLQSVQAAWSQHDLTTLRMVATPEMVAYFGEQLAEQTSRRERNVVSNVKLEQGDLSEAWAEDGREYATVAMRFSMVDVTMDATGRVTAGDAQLRTMTTELWTFLRAPGGQWVLSAIQQVR